MQKQEYALWNAKRDTSAYHTNNVRAAPALAQYAMPSPLQYPALNMFKFGPTSLIVSSNKIRQKRSSPIETPWMLNRAEGRSHVDSEF